ncbi:hypothetical protein BpHYR1_021902 [Brachionus plicatilis]|uniref:Uncharacterized protein n=1 Tax=Brachionus plicatilis TaxID=10195 RepID=A0A3M7PSP0_BRAPC|nr:hypothetical protein BpHYR1_021902 [Brachionus plicatilis]
MEPGITTAIIFLWERVRVEGTLNNGVKRQIKQSINNIYPQIHAKEELLSKQNLLSNKEIDIESLEDDDEEDDVVETTSKRAIMEKTNEIKSSSIQISCEKCNAKMFKKRFLLSKWLFKKKIVKKIK